MDLQFATSMLMPVLLVLLALFGTWFLLPIPWARILIWLGRKAAGFRSITTEVGGNRWHYLEGGKGPVLVMVHGFGATADHWLRIGAHLKRQFRVVAPDLVGFGTSSTGEDLTFDIASQAARLQDFLDSLGIGKCILAGSSMGGWISTAFAATNPGRVEALWLQAPLGVRNCKISPVLRAADEGRHSPVQLSSRQDFEAHVVRQMFVRVPWFPYPLRIHYGNDAVRRAKPAQRMLAQVRKASTPLEELAADVDVPVLLQWGKEDRVVDVSGVDALQGAFANVETRIQEKTGHLPMLESPGESLRLFLDFWHKNCRQARNEL